jgi:hypothetical protein
MHTVVRARVGHLVDKYAIALPQLAVWLELGSDESLDLFYPVPWFYGGLRFVLRDAGADSVVLVKSFCRVWGGSHQYHEVTTSGAFLTDDAADEPSIARTGLRERVVVEPGPETAPTPSE